MGRWVLVSAVACCAAFPLLAQPCPQAEPDGQSEVRTLEGELVFHDDIRGWFELKLDHPQCGEKSIQLVWGERNGRSLEILRGCRIRSRGNLGFSPTGYYSLAVFQSVVDVESVGACVRQPPFPDFSGVKPDKKVEDYRVEMHVNYEPGDHPIRFSISSLGRELRPWQAYANYLLTGGFVLYGMCAEGFVVDKVFGTREAKPSHFDERGTSSDMAMYDPETAAASGKKDLLLGYTCVRAK
jgi:hypothetical protein